MKERKTQKLRVIEAPRIGHVLDAPPVLKFSNHTISYTCGHCDTELMHAEEGQIYELLIRCNKCGSYNKAE